MKEKDMKKKIKYIDGDRVTLTNHQNEDNFDLPDDLDFSTLKEIPNPVNFMIMLDSDLSQYFKSSKQVNSFLRKHIKSLDKV